MKFNYEYRTKDNVRHSGVVSASDREAAYAQLKSHGIKPSRMTEAPGFFNKLFGKGKRWLAIALLGVLCLVFVAVALMFREEAMDLGRDAYAPMPRHQIYGDPAFMEQLERDSYAKLFRLEGDRFLARFVQPGVMVSLPSVRDFRARRELGGQLAEAIKVGDSDAVTFSRDDSRESCEIKRSVLWLRNELRRYLANGVGTPERYISRLEERQIKEVQIYNRIVSELNESAAPMLWDSRNETLRSLGIRTISRPEKDPQKK